eukprot:jgi/Psemu1/24609/gm1.24609_g
MATTKDTNNANAPANNDEPEPTPAESEMTEVIARDRPTIDAAVKSFISMVCARSMAASPTDTTKSQHDKVMMGIIPGLAKTSISSASSEGNANDQDNTAASTPASASTNSDDKNKSNNGGVSVQQQVLQLARLILKAVNSYTFPVHDTVAYSMAEKPGTTPEKKQELLETSVVSRLWNALVQSEQKPSRFLGRRALRLAWKNLDVEASLPPAEAEESEDPASQQHEWLRQFESLLFAPDLPLPSDISVDDDAALLWATDGGAAELAKRRQRRMDAAKERGPRTPS